MNRNLYRTTFSERLGMLVAVAEIMHACTKGSGSAPGGSRGVARAADSDRFHGPNFYEYPLRCTLISLVVGCTLWGEQALAAPPLPTGGTITQGAGSIAQSGNTLTVTQSSQSLAANWQTFDVSKGNAVVFKQPNTSSVALNRVIGPDASSIYGSLSANGKVFLVNPNGVLFAPGAQVSAGGLVASTLNISDADFAAGRYRFTQDNGPTGAVVNQGNINAGSVALIGPQVVNSGSITTLGGNTTLAAGRQVTVELLANGLLTAQVEVAAANAEVQNHGKIVADGGSVSLQAGRADTVLNTLINTDGVIQARSIRNENGTVYLDGGAGGTVTVSGTVDASAPESATGGSVRVLGEHVTLAKGARIDVSGQESGGTALIGGDLHGSNPEVLNSRSTTVEADAAIHADGAQQGGRVVVWSDDATQFAGEITAHGKGFTEVSGKGSLRFSGTVDTGGGTLLLDPTDITVQSTAGDQASTFSGSQITTLLGTNDVVLDASNNITWNSNATLDYNGIGNTGRTLTLQAGNNISYSGKILDSVAGGDKLNVVFNADRDASGAGGITLASGSSISTAGGDIILRGGNAALAALPVFTDPTYATALTTTAARNLAISGATLDAGGGNIVMRGAGTTTLAPGVSISGTVQTSGSGAITIDGIGGSGGSGSNRGIFTSSANISSADGSITLQGMGNSGVGTENSGIRVNGPGAGSTIQATGAGNITINGLGSTGGSFNDGIVVDTSAIRVNSGNLVMTGTGRGSGIGSDGVELANGSTVEATGPGNVTLNGTSSATGANTNRGVVLWLSAAARTTSGALAIQGSSANPAAGNGIELGAVSVGAGTIGGTSQSGPITLTADTMSFNVGTIQGSGTLLVQPLTPTASIGVGTGSSGTLNLTSAEIGLIQDGFSSITVGRSDGSGAVDVRSVTFNDPLLIRSPTSPGSIAVNGTLATGGSGPGDITLQSGGDIALNGGTITNAGALSLTAGGSYTVTGSSTLKSNTLAFGNTNGISDTGTLTFNQSSNTAVTNIISGTGNLIDAGAGRLTLTASNTYTGTTTINSGSTLEIGGTGSLGSGNYAGAITNNGALDYSSSASQTLAGAISGAGSLQKDGSSTLTLSGSNTYSGTTTINAGTLQVGNGGTTGTLGTGAVTDNATITLNRSNAMTVANTIGGTGNLLEKGGGTSTLSGNNSYSGGTTISNGILQTATSTAAGTGTVTLGDANTGSSNVAWRIAGSTNPLNPIVVSSNGTGTATLGGYSSGTYTVYGGTVQLNRDLIVQDDTGDRTGFTGIISGTGNITVSGRRVNIDNNSNTDTGTIAINPGSVLQINGNTAVASNVAINDIGAIWLNPSSGALAPVIQALNGTGTVSAVTGAAASLSIGNNNANGNFSGVISNSAAVVSITKIGTGTQILSGNNTYTGTTRVSAGTLQVGNGGTTGTLGTGAVTDNANLVFKRSDTVSLSTLASNAAGITGTGNVSALIGGGLTVDRLIALTGASSSILLEAGDTTPAGTASGGDVVLNSAVSTSGTGTITIFSGDATTAAYEARLGGASGATRYKTYGSSASDTSGAVAGTRNYYYRQQPTATISGVTASKTYDGLLDAMTALNIGGVTANGVDGDVLGASSLTATSASFDSAHAGSRAVAATFSIAPFSYSASGVTWSVSGYGSSNAAAGSGAISPKPLNVGINAVGKTYDGLTDTTSTLTAPSGFVGADSASGVSGLSLAFDNPNAGNRTIVASGTPSLASFTGAARGNGSGVGAGNEVGGLASDYVVVTPSPASAVITPASLTITANNDAKIVTQSDTPGYNGVSYSGFVHGDDPSGLTGTLAISRSNSGTQTAGSYSGVLVPSGLSSGNYTISYVNGNYQILAAQQLLVKIGNVSNPYGNSPGYAVTSAEYLDGSGTTIHALTQTGHSGNTYTYSDGIGGNVTFTITPQGADTSGAGYLAVGNYGLSGSNTQITGTNFVGLTFVGNQAVTQIGLTPVPGGVSKVYDGTTAMTNLTLGLAGELSGDSVLANGTGVFNTKNVGNNLGYTVDNMTLTGADAGNYYLSSGALSGNNGIITPKNITVGNLTAMDKVYDGTTTGTLSIGGAALNGVVAGDSVALNGAGYGALFGDRNVGTGKAVAVSGLLLSGTDAGNYTLTQPTSLTASITPKSLTVAAVSDTRIYDGTTNSSLIPTVTGLATGDSVSGSAIQSFDNRNAGTGKSLSAAAGSLVINDGNGGNNYAVTFVNNTTGVIDSRPLILTAVPNSKPYDGTANTVATPTVTGELVGGDRFTVLGEQYASTHPGTGLQLSPFFGIDDGNGGANYAITLVDNNAGVILPAAPPVDLMQLGGGNVASRLSGDSATSVDANGSSAIEGSRSASTTSSRQWSSPGMDGCERSASDEGHESDDHIARGADNGTLCAEDAASQTALIQVRSSGIRLPRGLAPSESFR